MIPFTPVHSFEGDSDPVALADQMLALLDESLDRLAIFALPIDNTSTTDRVEEWEDRIRAAYDVAKRRRPELAVRWHYRRLGSASSPQMVVELHEHEWIGGVCVNNCKTTRS